MGNRGYQDLIVWHKAIDFVEAIYRQTGAFPNEEKYGITAQLRRAAVSIPSNIAEGQARGGGREFGRFLDISIGSLAEVETQLTIANRLKYIDTQAFQSLQTDAAEIGRLLRGLIKSLRPNNSEES